VRAARLGVRAVNVLDLLGITGPEQYIERRDRVRASKNVGPKTLAELDAWAGISGNGARLNPARLAQLDSLQSQPTPGELRELVRAYCAFFHVKPRPIEVAGLQ